LVSPAFRVEHSHFFAGYFLSKPEIATQEGRKQEKYNVKTTSI
jgi:c-di-GMP-related signal transduction protein